VFPSAWCKKNSHPKDKVDCILNKTPLTARTNRRIGGVAPSIYLDRAERNGAVQIQSIVQSHLMALDALRRDDFDAFIRERARLLIDRVEAVTGKPIAGRDSSEVVKAFGGALQRHVVSGATPGTIEKLFSNYEILEKLRSGGMSEGYRVRSSGGTVCFLKKVPVEGISGDALRRELDIYARLQRAEASNVLEIYTYERSEDFLAIVVEFADGGSLADFVQSRGGSLPPVDAKSIALEVVAGLRELHSLEIVHRDIKPENIFRASARWKIGDFGISKNLNRLVTQGRTFQGHGTLGFAPPEQLDGAEAHPSADIYSFGKIIAFLITGQTDVDQIVWPAWVQLARHCTERQADLRPSLDEVETTLGHIAV
jgi:Protein kinase domain